MLTDIKLDKTAPTGSIEINNGASYTTSTSVTLSLTATDTLSGVDQVRFSNDGVWDTEPWESASPTKDWTLTSGDGEKTVYYQVKDTAGLVSSYTASITLDTTAPVANAGQSQTVNVGSSVSFDASGSTDNIGIDSYEWDFGDGNTGSGITTSHTYSSSGNYMAQLTVQDAAGNTATATVTINAQAPEPTPTPSPSPSPAPTQSPSPSPSPSLQPTQSPEPPPPEKPPLLFYVIAVVAVFALIGGVAFVLRKRRQQ
jgi:PKD repeat protein